MAMALMIYNLFLRLISFVLVLFRKNRNYIVFESFPDYSGSPKMICLELEKRGFRSKYHFVWAIDKDQRNLFKDYECVPFWGDLKFFERLKKNLIVWNSVLIVDSNRYVEKTNLKKTFRLYTQHGAPIKKVFDYTYALGRVDSVLSLSKDIAKMEHEIWPSAEGNFEVLGYPSNDALFESADLYKNGFWKKITRKDSKFTKILGWFPTYRQHRNVGLLGSSYVFPFGVPLLQNKNEFERINVYLQEKNVLLVVQMHHAQAENFPKQNYSNIVMIPSQLKIEMGISNANLMSSFDALITDYSGAYHEYLLLDRPIALSIDDIDEYSKNPGFSIDYFDWIKGVYLKDSSDLFRFIDEVVNGVDSAKEERRMAIKKIHKYVDANSTQRVVDFLCEKVKL